MIPYNAFMSEHKINNSYENSLQDKVTYVVQSYYDQNDKLVSRNQFEIDNGHPDNIQNLNCDELKHILVKCGTWPQYTRRIKNLEKAEIEFWKLYDQEVDLEKKTRTLENIVNMQSIISKFYGAAKDFLIDAQKGELHN